MKIVSHVNVSLELQWHINFYFTMNCNYIYKKLVIVCICEMSYMCVHKTHIHKTTAVYKAE